MNSRERNSLALSVGDRLQLPAPPGEVSGDPAGKFGGEPGQGVAVGGVELGPGVGAGHVDGGVLPHGFLGARQAPHAEAVHLDHLTRAFGVDVALRRRLLPLRCGWGGVAGDERQASRPGVEPVAAQHPPHPVR